MRRINTLFCAVFVIGLCLAASVNAGQIVPDQKSTVKGTIVSRNGDLVTVKDRKSGTKIVVDITDDSKIERKHGKVEDYLLARRVRNRGRRRAADFGQPDFTLRPYTSGELWKESTSREERN